MVFPVCSQRSRSILQHVFDPSSSEFEIHLTVSLTASNNLQTLQAWCLQNKLGCLHIVLDQGEITAQPMVTKIGRANLFDLYHLAPELADHLQTAGFPVIRTKIEIPGESELVPQTTGEARKNVPPQYFEHHLKLLLAPGTNLDGLVSLVKRHSAHLSHNALRVRPDRQKERFVTQRCFGVTREDARQQLGNLQQKIDQLGFRVIKTEAEYVLFDSNLALDAGWIPGKE